MIKKLIRLKYTKSLINYFETPLNVGSFSKEFKNIGTGLVGAPACGDVMKLQIKVNPKTNIIEDAKFKTFGCGSAIASSSYATEFIKNMNLEEQISNFYKSKTKEQLIEMQKYNRQIYLTYFKENVFFEKIFEYIKTH